MERIKEESADQALSSFIGIFDSLMFIEPLIF